MSRTNLKKRLARLGDQVDDFIEEANDAYESIRHDVKRKAKDIKGQAYDVKGRAEDAWDHRDDLFEDLTEGAMSLGEYVACAATKKFKSDPVGTIAIAAITLWVVGRLAKR